MHSKQFEAGPCFADGSDKMSCCQKKSLRGLELAVHTIFTST